MYFIKKLAIFIFDIIDKYIHQKNILKSLKKENISIKNFLDIGAHEGKYTDLIIKNYKIKKIYMFEPQPKFFKIIQNKYKKQNKINILNYAISNKNEKKILYINKHNLTSSIRKLNSQNKYLNIKSKLFGTNLKGMIEKKILIKTVTLKNFFLKEKISNIDLIKIDTEGHEYEVLIGLGDKIKLIKSILIEFHDNKTYLGYNSKKIEQLLKKNKFILKKTIKFPFTTWEDRIYTNNIIRT